MNNGASGVLLASQVAAARATDCACASTARRDRSTGARRIRTGCGVKWLDGPEEIRHAAGSYLSEDARAVTRLPGGHPEGYLEAFAVLYREFADALIAWKDGKADPLPATLPGIIAGSARHEIH